VRRDPLACGDFIAGRRFAYARAAADEGDFRAAAEVLEQALERAPDWAAAWFSLGEARERLGDVDAAADAFRATLRLDVADAQGATARLAFIGQGDVPPGLPAAYVARLFDQYAPRFEAHLTGTLGYRAPALIGEALSAAAPGRRFDSALDIGCGTGLMGVALRARVGRLTGVDLAPAMIAKAQERGAYDALIVGDATALLGRPPRAAFDLIVAADVLAYIGELAPLFGAIATALASGGLFAFSAETCEGQSFALGESMRFAHSRAYLEATARESTLSPLLIRSASIRREAKRDAPGLICVLERTQQLTDGPPDLASSPTGEKACFQLPSAPAAP
jgi:predicted TPR repeat methyltransferase